MKITFEIEPHDSSENMALIEHLARAFADRVHRERVVDKIIEQGANKKRDSEREGTD
jgi:hypothetical protein